MKKILYICNNGILGGATRSLCDSLLQLRKFVNPFVVIPEHGQIEEFLTNEKIAYELVPFERDYGRIGFMTQKDADRIFETNWQAAEIVSNVIRRNKIDLVHANSSVSNVGAFTALMCDVPYIYHIRELMPEQFGMDFCDWNVKQMVFEGANKLISISEYVRNTYLRKYGLDSIRIYNGLDILKYLRSESHSWSDAKFLVSGHITHEKGQFVAVQALSILSAKGYKDIGMDIVGTGRDSFKLDRYIRLLGLESKVIMHGFQKDLSGYQRNCNYALTTSHKEALGRVTIEAMLAGQFVIGTDNGGTKEIIGKNEERGLLFSDGNPESLADKMEQAIRMPVAEKEKIVKTAQEYAKETFSNMQYAESVSRLYDSVCAEYAVGKRKEILVWLKQKHDSLKQSSDGKKNTAAISHESTVSEYAKKIREWLDNENGSMQLADWLKAGSIKTVGIYGMGSMGSLLYTAMQKKGIIVVQMVDTGANDFDRQIGIKAEFDASIPCDLMIVSPLREQEVIVDDLQRRYKMKFIGLIKLYEEISGNISLYK